MRQPDEPAWAALAKELSGYVSTKKFRYLNVYDGEVPGFGLAAIIRIWSGQDDDGAIPEIKATIAITADIAHCSDVEGGRCEIDLTHPRSIEQILAWMISVGLAEAGTTLRGLLKG